MGAIEMIKDDEEFWRVMAQRRDKEEKQHTALKIGGIEYPIEFCGCCMMNCGIIPIVREGDPVDCECYKITQEKLKKTYAEKTN